MKRLNVYLLTGRTIEQGRAKEYGKLSEAYKDSVAVCFIDPSDMKKLKIKDNTPVRLTSDFGSIVLRALESTRAPHPGVVYVPYGFWVNQIVDPQTHSIGMPSFKGVPITIEPAPDESVPDIQEFLKEKYGGKLSESYK